MPLQPFSVKDPIRLVSLVYMPLLTLLGVAAFVLGLVGCDYPKKIQEFPEPWRNIDPGGPPSVAPRVEILTQGQGVAAESGDLVQVHVIDWFANVNQWHDFGDWWVWIGFNSQEVTPFYSFSPTIAGGLLGQKQGSRLMILDPSPNPSDHGFLGELRPNPFGDKDYYSWRKSTHDFLTPSPPKQLSGYSVLEIKRVCKGQTKSRTVRLFDDSPVQVCSGLNCRTTTEAREAWIDEARSDAVCQDGKKVSFQYGPIGSRNGKEGRSPKRGYFDEWLLKAWDKIPRGVRFEGNHAPVFETTPVKTKTGVALAIDFRKFAHDADGDSLASRIIRPPKSGKLIPNADGSMTYTPTEKFFGFDHATFGISDGMTETAGTIEIEVIQPAR